MSESCDTGVSADSMNCSSSSSTTNNPVTQANVAQVQSAGQCVGASPAMSTVPTIPPKDRIVYVLLAIFLGCFGVHNFYAGYVVRGIAQLLITVIVGSFTCGLSSIFIWVWAVIEACVISKDARGVPFK